MFVLKAVHGLAPAYVSELIAVRQAPQELPKELGEIASLNAFKVKLKNYFLSSTFERVGCSLSF